MKLASLIWLAIWIAGCSATYKQQIIKQPAAKLERGKGVFISTPNNGWYGKIEYKHSGQMTADAVKAAFSRFSDDVFISAECLSRECLKMIPTDKYLYYVEPEILHWEDRATEWSGMRDRIDVKISIYNSTSGSEITSSIITGTSKWATFGGDHPQDLLPEPLNDYVQSLY
jgi:hypothetical protein